MMPITMAGIGETCKIKKIGGNDAEISVVSAIGGNVIVNVKDARVAVNQDMARHIMI